MDGEAFASLVDGYRRELLAHCYRMLGSVGDAEDALDETLAGARRELPGLDTPSSPRALLYRLATHACLRLIAGCPGGPDGAGRMLPPDRGPSRRAADGLGEPVGGGVWLEPLPDELLDRLPPDAYDDPAARYQRRDAIELAFVAALQHLPATWRAVLIMRQVLGFSAEETAAALGCTPAAVHEALPPARRAAAQWLPETSQRIEVGALGGGGRDTLVLRFVTALEQGDVPALLVLLAEDARLTVPPRAAWFDGREEIGRIVATRAFATPWRVRPLRVNSQLGFACYRAVPAGREDLPSGGSVRTVRSSDGVRAPEPASEPAADRFVLGAVLALSVRAGLVTQIDVFLDPEVHRRIRVPAEYPVPLPDPGAATGQ